MAADQFSGANLLAGGALMASQSIDYSISPSKIRATQTLIPVTVKQLFEAYHSSEDKSAITVNGVEITNIRLVGLVVNKVERVTDVSFTIDDGTGRMDISRWANESSDSDEVVSFQNGMYVKVHGHLRGFHGKRHALAFSVQPVTDFNDVVLHYIECMHAHMVHIKLKGGPAKMLTNMNLNTPSSVGMMGYTAPFPHQLSAHSNVDGLGNDVYNLVLRLFQEPAMLSREHGLHLDEVFRRLNFPKNMIMEAINCLVDVGHIYSTVDEYHFRFARVGSVVLFIHDASDVFLEVGKMSKYTGNEGLAVISFVLFVASWIILRLIYFPFWILRSTSYEVTLALDKEKHKSEGPIYYYVFNTLLFSLLVLHIYWWVLIYRMLVKQVQSRGRVGDDVRSDSEGEDEHED